jgi:hypothetical protein
MPRKIAVGALVGIFLMSASWSVADVKVEHDPSVDFSVYKTYSWTKGMDANSPELQEYLVSRIDAELAAKGLRRVEEGGDLQVATHAYSLSGVSAGANYVYSPTWEVGIVSARAQEYTVGTLMVDLIDPVSNRNVWQGVAEESFGEANENKIRNRVDKVTRKMFKSYPPR